MLLLYIDRLLRLVAVHTFIGRTAVDIAVIVTVLTVSYCRVHRALAVAACGNRIVVISHYYCWPWFQPRSTNY